MGKKKPVQTKRLDKMDTAYHEAGHAVVAALMRLRFVNVSIVKQGTSLGKVYFDPNSTVGRASRKLFKPLPPQEMLDRIVPVLLAGDFALHIARGKRGIREHGIARSRQDFGFSEVIFLEYGTARTGENGTANGYRGEQEGRTIDLLGDNWLAVEVAAHALAKLRTLTYADVRRIIRLCQAAKRLHQ